MGKVKLLFFAHLKEQVGQGEMVMTIPEQATLKELLGTLEERLPHAVLQTKGVRIAVNHEIASDDAILKDGDEVALLPPFSGG